MVVAHSGERGFSASTDHFDVLLLDLNLPDRDGLSVLAALRECGIGTTVLVLTARDTLAGNVIGLDAGADDYLAKPFAFAELLARVRALLRRGRAAEVFRYEVADLEMDLVTRQVTRAGRSIELTVREFELLEYLLRFERQAISRQALGRAIWKEQTGLTTLGNVIDVHIARLRKKIDAGHVVKLIHTIRGVGFMLRDGQP